MFLKKMKSLTAIAISGLMIFGVSGNVSFADDQNNISPDMISFDLQSDTKQEISITRSEYDMIKELNRKSNQELRALNYSNDEINDLRNYKSLFNYHIENLNLLSDQELKNLDYIDEQINIIRNFNGTEDEIETVAAQIKNTISKNSSSSTSTKSKLNVLVRFSWSGNPIFRFNDAFAMVNGEEMYYDNENTKFTTTYRTASGLQKTFTGYLKRANSGNTGASTQFPVERFYAEGAYFIKSGSANVGLNKSAKVTQCGIGVNYGHAGININGISVSYKDIGISFGGNVTPTYNSSVFGL